MTDISRETAFRQRIKRMEAMAAAHPLRYRLTLALLAIFGYAVLLASVLLALAISLGLAVTLFLVNKILFLKLLKLIWIPILLGWMILRALWVRIDPPSGRRITADEAPELFRQIEALRSQSGAPAISGVVIDEDLNAAAASVPRLLGLAGSKHYLLLGLPLLQSLSPAEMSSVIAHEFGHFGGRHGRFTGWIYRQRMTWFRLLSSLEAQQSLMGAVFARFFQWYAPYFDAYSYVLARSNEYEADRMAVAVAGAEATGNALIRVNLLSRHLGEDFWPELGRRVTREPQAPVALYDDIKHSLRSPHKKDVARLEACLASQQDIHDTHPTLRQRLDAIGASAQLPPAISESAAEVWLGPLESRLQHAFSEDWRSRNQHSWADQHARGAEARSRWEQLTSRAEADGLEGDEWFEWAELSAQLGEHDDARPLYFEAARRLPEHGLAQFRAALLMLENDDSEGLGLAERAIALNADLEIHLLGEMLAFHQRCGDESACIALEARIDDWQRRQTQNQVARENLGTKDQFAAHGLDDATLDMLRRAMREHGKIAKAWIVRKEISGGGPVHHVMVVALRFSVLNESTAMQRLTRLIELPGSWLAINRRKGGRAAKRLIKVAGKPFYVR